MAYNTTKSKRLNFSCKGFFYQNIIPTFEQNAKQNQVGSLIGSAYEQLE